MERRSFLKVTATTAGALAASGQLPLLAADGRRRKAPKGRVNATNIFTDPCAIEPVSGVLAGFVPVGSGTMRGPFKAEYSLLYWSGAGEKSRNVARGTMAVSIGEATVATEEKRQDNLIRTAVHCAADSGTVKSWVLDSSFGGDRTTRLSERGTWDGRRMTVKAGSWTQARTTENPLRARWGLLPLVAAGKVKRAPLSFDMLDDSALRPDQRLRYEGQVTIPVKGGTATLDSYIQTGRAVVPTHYLVDRAGRVQLITASFVNWVLKSIA